MRLTNMTKTDLPPSDAEKQESAAVMPSAKKPNVEVHDISKLRGHLKAIGGSMSDDWNNVIASQTTRTLWFFENSDRMKSGGNAMRQSMR
jgi:hypothetical protein